MVGYTFAEDKEPQERKYENEFSSFDVKATGGRARRSIFVYILVRALCVSCFVHPHIYVYPTAYIMQVDGTLVRLRKAARELPH